MMPHSLPDIKSKTSSMDIEPGKFTSIHQHNRNGKKNMNMDEFLL
jgi:hypothetical protein